MDPLKFIFELIDQMTGPSKAITKELKAVDAQIKVVDASLKKTAIDKMAPGLAKTRAELVMQKEALAETAAATFRFADATEGARDVLNTVGKIGLGVAGAVAGVGFEFAKNAVEVASFAEDSKIALEVFTGSGEAANRILKNMIGLAAHLPINDMEAMAAATRLMTAGFKESELTNLITTMAAVQGFGHGKQGMGNFVNQMLEIKAAGITDRNLLYLSRETGINETQIQQALQHVGKHGEYANIKTVEQMKSAVSAHQVNGDDFTEAVVRAVAKMTGGDLSNLPGKLSKTFSGMTSTLEGRKFALMIDLDTSPGYASFRGFLANLVEMTDPQSSTGKLIAGQLAASFNDLFGDIFAKYAGPDGAQKIGDTIRNDVIPAFRDLGTVVGGIAGATMTVVSGWADLIRLMRGTNDKGQMLDGRTLGQASSQPFFDGGQVGKWISTGLTPEAQVRANKAGLLDPVHVFLGKLGVGQGNDGRDIGGRVTSGYANGIRDGIPDVVTAHEDLAGAGIDATKGVLKVQSPSRVFEEIGAYTTEGFVRGVRSGTDEAQDALGAMVSPGRGGAFATLGAGGRQIVINMPISIDARGATSDDADDISQKIADAVPARLVQAFEMIAAEMGNN